MIDPPLLALTRRSGAAVAASAPAAAGDNLRQLIQLRWIAVVGQCATILIVHFGFGLTLPLMPMAAVLAVLALTNVGEMVALARHRVTNAELLVALLVDMGALTLQFYLSGGATNPFTSLYLLQVVLGAILLERWSVWVLVVATALCYALLSVRFVPLVFPPGLVAHTATLYTLGNWLGFVMAGILLVLFTTRISRNLRARDAYLADLRQHAVEEDAIVRIGLFASGAAHELGSPLGSLSVILADWRRLAAIANDPALAGEVAEMEAEVQRCKRIVADILHAAGEPRGEAMTSAATASFLNDAVAAWRAAHTAVPLDYHGVAVEGTAIVADRALRQAIWNLLDNAAEASPGGIALRASLAGDTLAIAVSDHGPGFAPDRLASVGQPYQSTKGAGHGIGLFLAVNVARRLGGRLEAVNLTEGGARVTLVLPLVSARAMEG